MNGYMVFKLNPDQESFQQTIIRFLESLCSSERRRARIGATTADEAFWKGCSDLALFELFEDFESSSMIELGILSYECGKHLATEDIAAAIFLGTFLPARDNTYKKSFGALGENCLTGFGISMNNSIDFVPGYAKRVIFSDQTFSSFSGFNIHDHGQQHSSLDITRTYSRFVNKKGISISSPELVRTGLFTLRACEISGICAAVIEMTRNYCLTRKQFGVEIGAFQAVQQQLADIYVKSEGSWALSQFAAWSYDHSPEQRVRASYAALNYAISEASNIIETTIQLHGGIGFTWEHDLHLYLRRAKLHVALFGTNWDHSEALLT